MQGPSGQHLPSLLATSQRSGPLVGRSARRFQVLSVDLEEVAAELTNLTLVVCSDGVWDLWEYDEVFQGVVAPPKPGGKQGTQVALDFLSKTSVARGAEMFDSTADNMTGVVVYLSDAATAGGPSPQSLSASPKSAGVSPKSDSALSPNSFFSV